MQKRAVIYARVSTLDKGQDPENQLIQLRDYAKRRGFHLVGEFVDHASGASEQREEYQKMINQVRKRKVDVVLVWRYGRFARSTQTPANALKEFHSLGMVFISYEGNVDTAMPQGIDLQYRDFYCAV